MLETARCVLTPPVAGDLKSVQTLYGNEKVRAFLGGVRSSEEVERAFTKMLSAPGHRWAIRRREDHAFVGMVSLDPHHDGEATEISFQLLPEFWGSGFAAETVGEVIRHAFDEVGLGQLFAETQAANTASRRLLVRLGMKEWKRVERFGAEQVIYTLEKGRADVQG